MHTFDKEGAMLLTAADRPTPTPTPPPPFLAPLVVDVDATC